MKFVSYGSTVEIPPSPPFAKGGVSSKRLAGSQNRQQGFTLLELLVVLLIIGITVSFAVLSIGDRGREHSAELEAQSLAARMSLAGQESVLQSKEMALQLTKGGYHFLTLDEDEWRVIDDDEILHPRRLPPGLKLELKLEGQAVSFEDKQDKKQAGAPLIYLLSSGEMTPFELLLLDEYGANFSIIGETSGKLNLIKLKDEAKT